MKKAFLLVLTLLIAVGCNSTNIKRSPILQSKSASTTMPSEIRAAQPGIASARTVSESDDIQPSDSDYEPYEVNALKPRDNRNRMRALWAAPLRDVQSTLVIDFIDVGQGDCTLISFPNG